MSSEVDPKDKRVRTLADYNKFLQFSEPNLSNCVLFTPPPPVKITAIITKSPNSTSKIFN